LITADVMGSHFAILLRAGPSGVVVFDPSDCAFTGGSKPPAQAGARRGAVIEPARSTHYLGAPVMLEMALSTERVSGPTYEGDRPTRLARMFIDNYWLVWRLVRRLGIPWEALEDATREVLLVAAERHDDIRGNSERAFVYGIALRVVRSMLRDPTREPPTDRGDRGPSPLPRPDELADRERAIDALVAKLGRCQSSKEGTP
jgi:hypothetical protein